MTDYNTLPPFNQVISKEKEVLHLSKHFVFHTHYNDAFRSVRRIFRKTDGASLQRGSFEQKKGEPFCSKSLFLGILP